MKAYITILFVSIIFLFASCGEDNITNNSGSNNDPQFIFVSDSLSIWSSDYGVLLLKDSVKYQTSDTSIKKLNITFTLQSNMDDSSSSFFIAGIYGADTSFHSIGGELFSYTDSSYNYTVEFRSRDFIKCYYYISLTYNNSHDLKYIRFKNIKVKRIF